jgi:hypothetical protein
MIMAKEGEVALLFQPLLGLAAHFSGVSREPRGRSDDRGHVAQTIRHTIIRRNTKDLIHRSRGAYGNTRSVLDYGSLIEVVYWHLSKMDQKLVRQCEKCSAWFTTQHGRQRFCPPRESQRESSCAVNHRQWKYRQEKRKKKQVSTA